MEDSLSGSTFRGRIRNRPGGDILGVGQRSWIRGAEEEVARVHLEVDISRFVGDDLEDVGITIPATKRRKAPVDRHAGDGGIMVVESIVGRAFQRIGDGAAEENREGLVGFGLGFNFVKREQDQGVLHEVRIVE